MANIHRVLPRKACRLCRSVSRGCHHHSLSPPSLRDWSFVVRVARGGRTARIGRYATPAGVGGGLTGEAHRSATAHASQPRRRRSRPQFMRPRAPPLESSSQPGRRRSRLPRKACARGRRRSRLPRNQSAAARDFLAIRAPDGAAARDYLAPSAPPLKTSSPLRRPRAPPLKTSSRTKRHGTRLPCNS